MFTTIAKVKTHLGITVDTYDAVLTTLVSAATASMQKIMGRELESDTYTQTFRSTRLPTEFILDEWPVTSITSITDADDDTIDSDNYEFDEDTGIIYICDWTSGITNCGYYKFTVTYVAGYSTIPADVDQACIEYVKQMYLDKETNPNLSGEKLGDYSYSRMSSDSSISSRMFMSTLSAHSRIETNYVG